MDVAVIGLYSALGLVLTALAFWFGLGAEITQALAVVRMSDRTLRTGLKR